MKVNIIPIIFNEYIDNDWIKKINRKIEIDLNFINLVCEDFEYDSLVIKPRIDRMSKANVKYTMRFENIDDDEHLNDIWHHCYPKYRKHFQEKWNNHNIMYIVDSDVYDDIYPKVKIIIHCVDNNLDQEFVDKVFE
jgi:hypothetical protein